MTASKNNKKIKGEKYNSIFKALIYVGIIYFEIIKSYSCCNLIVMAIHRMFLSTVVLKYDLLIWMGPILSVGSHSCE
jgi:hypothetical protein